MNDETMACVVLNYNDWSTTLKMVNVIKNYKSINNVVIVDNDSPNDSFLKLREEFKNNSKVHVIKSKKNGGYGYGNNIGINYAYEKLKDKYVILSNPDVMFKENMICNLVKIMIEKNAAMVSGVQYVNGKPIPYKSRAWRIPTAFQYTFSTTRIAPYINYSYTQDAYAKKIMQVDCVPGAMMLIDAKKFISVGGYDERMFLFCEETTIGYKFKQKGYKTYLLNNERYDHLVSVSINKNIPQRNKQTSLIMKNRLFFIKHYLQPSKLEYFIDKQVLLRKIRLLEKK